MAPPPKVTTSKTIPKPVTDTHYLFEPFYHPYVCEMIRQLNRHGIDGLLNPTNGGDWKPRQVISKTFFNTDYEPTDVVIKGDPVKGDLYPKENVDFSYGGGYSLYNWELFFHAPLLIADRLSKNQRFEDAQKWFHYIFDPTESEGEAPDRFWKIRPFFENQDAQRTIQDLMLDLNKGDSELANQVAQWQDDPFKPHLIARMRITPYQKTVVMKYIDNLVAWGDQLFRRETIESINEATQLYILAAEILGKRADRIVGHQSRNETFNSLKEHLDDFSNVLVQMENLISAADAAPASAEPSTNPPPGLETLYFCIPENDKLLGYWDTVADRLFKIRHCMNIEGVVRQLPLFEPPIDPALLVKAAAAGVDISSALNDMNAPLPHYRFNVMVQKASELCSDVKALGGALLAALEKKDAEEMALLRSSHELKVLDAVKETKKQQIEEAKEAEEALRKSRLVTEARRDYYRDIEKINDKEQLHMDSLGIAHTFNQIAQVISGAASTAFGFPEIDIGTSGWAGTPVVKVRFGGSNVGQAMQAFASVNNFIAAQYTHDATMASIKGGYDRRWDDWKLQEKLATKELDQIDRQIAAAEIRVAIAEQELKNHDLQVENAKEVDTYMRGKYTNRELYDWMVSQISAIYFQSYQMAYDIAKRAERAYRFELGLSDSNFIQFGYWDSLKKGLLAGERLHYDLKRMEIAYLDQNKREYEITKHYSLGMWDPLALVMLKENGQCFFRLPEAVSDLEYPGHYMRRIKSVSLTIPCVTGPYTSVNCTLTLLKNSVRKNSNPSGNEGNYTRDDSGDDPRFADSIGAIQSIVTSSAQNDSGIFESNLRDERYLPFEGAGAISEWRLEMPKEFRQFDYDTISDVILHLRYTAREGGAMLKSAAIGAVKSLVENAIPLPLVRLFSAKHEFPSEWHKFLHPTDTATSQTLQLDIGNERFPFHLRGRNITVNQVKLFLKLANGAANDNLSLKVTLSEKDLTNNASPVQFAGPEFTSSGSPIGTLLFCQAESIALDIPKGLVITATKADLASLLQQSAIDDIWVMCVYSAAGAP